MEKVEIKDLFEERFSKNATDFSSESVKKEIASFCSVLLKKNLFTVDFSWDDFNLYRVRYDEGFDTTDLSQFSYIQDTSRIRRLRYNLPKEQVLYTATHPYVAFRETEFKGAPSYFFLSIWRKKPEYNGKFNVYAVFPSDSKKLKGNAGSYRDAMFFLYSTMPYNQQWAHSIGQYLESSKEYWPNKEYILSSSMAHCILKDCDALLTVSQKSDDSELNITFNKSATDKLALKVIYRCKTLDYNRDHNKTELLYEVDKIGIPKDGRIDWHSFRIVPDSITPVKSSINPNPKEKEALERCSKFAKQQYSEGEQPDNLKISVQQDITDVIRVCATWSDVSCVFEAKIELIQ